MNRIAMREKSMSESVLVPESSAAVVAVADTALRVEVAALFDVLED